MDIDTGPSTVEAEVVFTAASIKAAIAAGMNGPRIIEELGGEAVAELVMNGAGVIFKEVGTGLEVDATRAFDAVES